MKKRLIILLLILSFSFLPFFNAYAYSEEYEIDNYDVNIKVLENHVLEVTETIDANFFVQKHGIKRNLPKTNTYKRNINGEEVDIESNATLSNYSVNEQFTMENSYSEYVFKIGNPNKTITGLKQYVIKYKYDMGEDYIPDFDDLYYNIIGTNWDCKIKNVTFKIEMPKEFDQTKINFTIGKYGATYNEDITYKVENNIISGSINKVDGYALSSYEGLTVRIELPEGYYTNENLHMWFNNPKGMTFDYEKLHIKATLNKNNTMHVEEDISAKFYQEYGNITKRIKYKGSITRRINYEEKEQAIDYIISNIKTNGEKRTYKDADEFVIMIDNYEKKDLNKIYDYTLSYDIDFGDDLVDVSDIFQYTFKDDTEPVRDFYFELNLPDKIDIHDMHLLSGTTGVITYKSPYDYHTEYNDNKVVLTYDKNYWGYSLQNDQNFIVRIDLPEGYFTNERQIKNSLIARQNMKVVVILIFTIVSTMLYLLFGLRIKKPLVVYYNSPDDLDPAEVGYVYKGKIKNNHIISLIIYFANKGYLSIESINKRNFELTKLKDIKASEPDYANITFNGLFPGSTVKTNKKKLQNAFYTSLDRAKLKLKKTHKIYKTSHYMSISFYAVAILMLFIISAAEKTFINTYVTTDTMLLIDKVISILVKVSIILNIVYIVFSKKMTEETDVLYNKILGFKDFLLKVEKEKLELLVEENPNYFYDILPYAYVLGISDKWCKKFEGIDMKAPSWYTGNVYNVNTGMFSPSDFAKSFNDTFTSVSASASSRPYESSGGGYSGGGSFSGGGGSSGGGGGGGGGSSW